MKSQFFMIVVSRGMSSILQAVSLLLLVRWLGADDFGAIAVITGVAAVVFTVSDWGAASHVPRARAQRNELGVVSGIRLSSVGNGVAGACFTLTVVILCLVNSWDYWLAAVPLALAAEQCIETLLTVSVADQSKRVVVYSLSIRRVSSLVVFIGFYLLGLDAMAAYGLSVLTGAGLGLLHIWLDVRQRIIFSRASRLRLSLLRDLAPYTIANLSSASRNLDTAIVAAVLSVGAAGHYSAAFRLTRPLYQVGGAASAILLPHSARSSAVVAKKAAMRLGLYSLGGAAFAAFIGIWSDEIVFMMFGPEFVDSSPVLFWALLAVIPICMASPLGSVLQGQGCQKYVAINGSVFGIVTLAAVWSGATYFGAEGAAAGLCISYVLKCVSLLFKIRGLPADSALVTGRCGRKWPVQGMPESSVGDVKG